MIYELGAIELQRTLVICCITRRSLKILALCEDHALKRFVLEKNISPSLKGNGHNATWLSITFAKYSRQ